MLLKETALLRLLGLRIPMLLFVAPRVVELDDEGCAVIVPLTFLTKEPPHRLDVLRRALRRRRPRRRPPRRRSSSCAATAA